MEILLILVVIVVAIYFAFLPKKEDEEESQPIPKLVNEENVKAYFKYPDEIPTIYSVRLCEQGRKGREFGVLAQGAIDTDLRTQAEWTMSTLIKDTKRWHTDTLANGKKKSDYPGFIFYFADKWAPSGADNDPNNLNKYWLPNVQKFYSLFKP